MDFVAAAKIIQDKVQEKICDCKSYPTNEDIIKSCLNSSWIPHHLLAFLKLIVISDVKQDILGKPFKHLGQGQ